MNKLNKLTFASDDLDMQRFNEKNYGTADSSSNKIHVQYSSRLRFSKNDQTENDSNVCLQPHNPQISSKLCTLKALSLLIFFEASKVNLPQVAVFDKNMAVEK